MIGKIIWIYVGIALSIILHESAHFIVGLLAGIKSANLYIGDEFFRINIGKIHFSPLVYSGFVEFDKDIYTISQKRLALTFFSGAAVNAIVAMAILMYSVIAGFDIVTGCILYVNIVLAAGSVLPVKTLKNDWYEFWRIITEKSERVEKN